MILLYSIASIQTAAKQFQASIEESKVMNWLGSINEIDFNPRY